MLLPDRKQWIHLAGVPAWRLELLAYAGTLALLTTLAARRVPESPAYLSAVKRSQAFETPASDQPRASGLAAHWRVTARAALSFAAASVVYYSLTFQAGSLSSSLELNVALLSLLELPGYQLANALGASSLGTHKGAAWLFGGTACSLAALGVSSSAGLPMGPTAFLGKMCAAGAFQLVSLLPQKDLPPTLRATGYGVCSTVGRIVTILVPALASSLPIEVASLLNAVLALAAAAALWY